jgi:hypothetical protein
MPSYAGGWIGFVDAMTAGQAVVGVRCHPDWGRVVVSLDLWKGDDTEAAFTRQQALALLEALGTALDTASEGALTQTSGLTALDCTDIDCGTTGKAVLRWDEATVVIRLAVPSHDMIALELGMTREDADALRLVLKAAIGWTFRGRADEEAGGGA